MSEVRIAAEPRTEFGKGGARRTRRAGKVPAVIYGHGQDVRHVSLPARELLHAFKSGSNVLLRLDLGNGETELALPKAVVKHPIRGEFEHLDLLAVRQGEQVQVDVQLAFTGEAPREGILDTQRNAITVMAEATHIPTSIEVSLEGLAGGHAIHVRDIELPKGVTLVTDADEVVVHVLTQTTEATDEAAPAEGTAAPAEDAADAAASDEG